MELLKSTKTELCEVKEELVAVETRLGAKTEELTALVKELKVRWWGVISPLWWLQVCVHMQEEMMEKVNDVESTHEEIKYLEANIEVILLT